MGLFQRFSGGVMGRMNTTLLLIAAAGLAVYLLHQSATVASNSSTATGGSPSGVPTSGGPQGTTPSGSPPPEPVIQPGAVLPEPAVPPPPAYPIQTGVPIQTRGKIQGLYTNISYLNPPGFQQTAAGWNQALQMAVSSYQFATGDLSIVPSPDPMQLFGSIAGYDGSQLMDLPTYWAAASVYLKNTVGLSGIRSGIRSWAV